MAALSAATGPVGAGTLWQIGKPDNSWREFAIAGNHGAYPKSFPKDVTYVVSRSDPARDWPFIHPGPVDYWAGARQHPFRIEFPLDRPLESEARLTLDFVNTHYGSPPTVVVDLNGTRGEFFTPAGAGDDSLTDPAKGREYLIVVPFAGSLLRVGQNVLTLNLTEGSWALYDAVTFETGVAAPAGPDVKRLEVRPTVLFKQEGEKLCQALEVSTDNWGKATPARIEAWVGAEHRVVDISSLGFGRTVNHVLVSPVEKPTPGKFTLTVGEHSLSAEATVEPQRKWTVFLSPHIHTDIGYTDTQPRITELHERNIDQAMAVCDQLPDFTWNCEVAWQAQAYLRDQPPKKGQQLLNLMRQGRIGVHACYMNMLTGLCSHEELNRITYFAKGLNRLASFAKELEGEHGIRVVSATITDVPSCVGTLPMVLARSGVRYFSEGINGDRGPFFWSAEVKSPFYWEGPDGSKVLTWFTPGYAQLPGLGLMNGCNAVNARLPGFLRSYDRPDYPYDAVLVYGAFGDNSGFDGRFGTVAAEWNSKWAYPKLVLARDEQFFEHIEKHFADKVPTFKGDAGAWWEDGAASSAAETLLNRRTHEDLTTAEKLASLTVLAGATEPYPARVLSEAWDDVLWYDEHTWGAWCSISQPEAETTKEQWKHKAAPAYRAAEAVSAVKQRGLATLGSLISTGKTSAVLVFNPLSWTRTDVVQTTLRPPADENTRRPQLVDLATGRPTRTQVLRSTADTVEVAFVATNVPSLGYKTFEPRWSTSKRVGAGQLGMGLSGPATPTFDNRFFRVQVDPKTGGLSSIFDKQLRRELLDSKSSFKANQYIYVSGGEGTQAIHPDRSLPPPNFVQHTLASAEVAPGQSGPVFTSFVIKGSALRTPKLESEVVLYSSSKRIDFVNRLTKEQTYEKEAVYFAYPFAFESPQFTYEVPDGIVRVPQDLLKGACLDWFSVQHWADVSGKDGGVTWACPNTPLACFGDITPGKWLTEFKPSSATLFAYAMNNYWHTNYKAGQGGDFTFRYSLTSHARGCNPVAATRFGWEVATPLEAIALPPNHTGPVTASSGAFVTVSGDNVVVLTAKEAEDRNGWIVRLWEVAGQRGTVCLTFPCWQVKAATLANLVEEDQKPLPIRGRSVLVPVDARGVMTVRVR